MNKMKALLLLSLGLCIVLPPLMGIDLYHKEGITIVSALGLVALSIVMLAAIWQFMITLSYGVHKRIAVAQKVIPSGVGSRWVTLEIPDFGFWEIQVPAGMAMQKGDFAELSVKVDCCGRFPRIVPKKIGNINGRK